MKRTYVLAAVGLLAAGCLFAQGGKEAPAAAESNELKGSLTVATNTGDPTLSAVKKVIDKFMEQNPGVSVEYTTYGKDYENLMKAKMAANDLPDMFATHGWAVKRYAEYLEPLNDLSCSSRLTDSIKGVVTTPEGNVVTIPFTVDNKGVIYNPTLLQQLGKEIPKTWDEFLDCCEAAKQAGIIPVYVAGKDNRSQAQIFDTTASTWLVTYKDGGEANRKALLDGTFDWSQWSRVAGFLKTLSDKGYLNKDANTADPVYRAEKLAHNEVLFMFQNWSEIQGCLEINPDSKVTMMPVPTWKADDEPVLVGGEREAYGIWKDSPNKKLAEALLEFMALPENATAISEESGMPTGFSDVHPNLPVFNEFMKYGNLRTMPIFDREWLPSGMWATMRTTGAGITSGEMSVEDACKAMEENYKSLLSQK